MATGEEINLTHLAEQIVESLADIYVEQQLH